ncbi:major capsid protein [Tortoise microvirus 47]|nr:major capsid protein [Tortoise microvirus 47]
MRRQSARGITSLPAGKMVPIAAFPLLREDAIRSGRLRFSFESMETAEILMNAINVCVMAYLVPNLALERFNGSMDQLNLSYEGKPPLDGEPVTPYIETAPFGAHGTNDIYTYLGLHGRPTQQVNTAYLEAYNCIWNFRAKNRSKELSERARLQTDLAPAFWSHDMFKHIVPDFDQAAIDGEVPLNITDGRMPVRGIGLGGTTSIATNSAVRESGGTATYARSTTTAVDTGQSVRLQLAATGTGTTVLPDIYAEMEENGITVSLSNIELARKTQAFAKLRTQYNAHDDWIINLLMDGISIPEQAFKQPMLLAEKRTIFGMAKRYASDSGNLTESVVNGATFLDMSIQLPRIGTGGVVMIVAEITPDQLFERQEDPYLHTTNVEQLPQYLRDTLDPEKVDIVKNGRIDVDHDQPDATFGYEPLNARWNINAPRIGARFYRPEVDAGFDEDRQRIWAVETKNPTLSTDFYLCTNMHTKPFVVTNQDPFEVVTQGDVFIEGNTVFGGHLIEATDDYEKVLAVADQTRIEKEQA